MSKIYKVLGHREVEGYVEFEVQMMKKAGGAVVWLQNHEFEEVDQVKRENYKMKVSQQTYTDGGEYCAERILRHRERNGDRYYQIEWVRYPHPVWNEEFNENELVSQGYQEMLEEYKVKVREEEEMKKKKEDEEDEEDEDEDDEEEVKWLKDVQREEEEEVQLLEEAQREEEEEEVQLLEEAQREEEEEVQLLEEVQREEEEEVQWLKDVQREEEEEVQLLEEAQREEEEEEVQLLEEAQREEEEEVQWLKDVQREEEEEVQWLKDVQREEEEEVQLLEEVQREEEEEEWLEEAKREEEARRRREDEALRLEQARRYEEESLRDEARSQEALARPTGQQKRRKEDVEAEINEVKKPRHKDLPVEEDPLEEPVLQLQFSLRHKTPSLSPDQLEHFRLVTLQAMEYATRGMAHPMFNLEDLKDQELVEQAAREDVPQINEYPRELAYSFEMAKYPGFDPRHQLPEPENWRGGRLGQMPSEAGRKLMEHLHQVYEYVAAGRSHPAWYQGRPSQGQVRGARNAIRDLENKKHSLVCANFDRINAQIADAMKNAWWERYGHGALYERDFQHSQYEEDVDKVINSRN